MSPLCLHPPPPTPVTLLAPHPSLPPSLAKRGASKCGYLFSCGIIFSGGFLKSQKARLLPARQNSVLFVLPVTHIRSAILTPNPPPSSPCPHIPITLGEKKKNRTLMNLHELMKIIEPAHTTWSLSLQKEFFFLQLDVGEPEKRQHERRRERAAEMRLICLCHNSAGLLSSWG